jgi:hypothetical protein
MSEDYDAIADEVAEAIADEGFDCVLTKITRGSDLPWDDTADTSTDSTVKVVETKPRKVYRDNMLVGHFRVLLMGAGIEPAMGDQITVLGKKHKIEAVQRIAPAGVAVLYKVEILA